MFCGVFTQTKLATSERVPKDPARVKPFSSDHLKTSICLRDPFSSLEGDVVDGWTVFTSSFGRVRGFEGSRVRGTIAGLSSSIFDGDFVSRTFHSSSRLSIGLSSSHDGDFSCSFSGAGILAIARRMLITSTLFHSISIFIEVFVREIIPRVFRRGKEVAMQYEFDSCAGFAEKHFDTVFVFVF